MSECHAALSEATRPRMQVSCGHASTHRMATVERAVLNPGLLILHGNRLEQLAEALFAWLARNPLGALEEECFLVQSNGMAEWLKMELASSQGVCAATRVELPARFLWRAYRAVLGRSLVPPASALDKLPLTWRLMGLLPELATQPGFEPVAGFLGGGGSGHGNEGGSGDPGRRLQLAQRLADLFDQYQVYRSDWLHDWADGHDVLRAAAGAAPVPAPQRWQPPLWRAVLAGLTQAQRQATRPRLHQRFLEALASSQARHALPRRIVLFGTTHIPNQTLEAICALSAHCQVLMAVPNPCRFHWADIIDGRELLRSPRHRQPARAGRELAGVALQDMHLHAHPLLAAWGRQARDFVRQLDAFDDVETSRSRFNAPRVDLFDDAPGASLLEQVQARIRDLVPLAEHPQVELASVDRSIVFHVAHGAQREVEILHDQLLHLFAHPPGGRVLNPRDVVVMVPDIDNFAAAIRSVFGQYARGHARHIPWGITDQRDRGQHPLLVALEWLLRAPQQRFAFSELRDLLDVPAVARRFEIEASDQSVLLAWIAGAGVRWGLHAAHRDSLGLQACGDANTWHFGLSRMLLGYATGELDAGFDGIEPYDEVAGLSAGLAGALAELLGALEAWWLDAFTPRSPPAWGERLRALLAQMFTATDDTERALMAALDDALTAWLQACEGAAFDAAVDLAVVREAWLAGVDEPGVMRRFKAGGVTFCTLLPMRAIPFEVVCLLGMNDGDYPRRSARSDFDLMAVPGQARPGDRSRRDDDRQLMLDALLSARRVLYVSWAGRSQRDNQEQPPSVLVAQLRDYLAAGWSPDEVEERTVQHPMQPFSRKYFEPKAEGAPDQALITYATEWRAAYVESPTPTPTPTSTSTPGSIPTPTPTSAAAGGALVAAGASMDAQAPAGVASPTPLTIARLASFLRNPVKEFFRHRLQVSFDDTEDPVQDDETFVPVGLERWHLLVDVIRAAQGQLGAAGAVAGPSALGGVVAAQVARLQRAGRLPLAGPGALLETELAETLRPMFAQWQALHGEHPRTCEKQPLHLAHPDDATVALDDWLVGLRSAPEPGAPVVWIELLASRIADKKLEAPRPDKLLTAWLRCLASAACGTPADAIVIGADAWMRVTPPSQDVARPILLSLMQACVDGLRADRPVPTAVRTGLAWLDDPGNAWKIFEGSNFGPVGEGHEACLARLYPDFASLAGSAGFEAGTRRLYAAYRDWLAQQTVAELPGHATLEDPGDD